MKGVALAIILAAAALVLPHLLSPFYIRVLQLLFFSAALALAWNILGGLAGYWSFGHTVFIGMGAFAAAHLSAALGGGDLWQMAGTIAFGGLLSAAFAAVIAYPMLRLRGVYFAIAMLGVGEVVAEVVNNVSWFQGDVGVFIAAALPANMAPERFYYYVFGGLLLLCVAITAIVRRIRFGYGLLAIREDEDTAKMLGVPTEQLKIAAFVLSAALVGILGAAYGYSLNYFTTESVFRIDFSLNMMIYCLIGGIGTLAGPLLGTAVMLLLVQVVLGSLLELHLLITGLVVVLIVLAMPNGIIGVAETLKRRRERPLARPAGAAS